MFHSRQSQAKAHTMQYINLTKICYATDVKDLAEGTLHFGSNFYFELNLDSSRVITAALINRSASKRTNTPGTSHRHTRFWFIDEGCYKFEAYSFYIFPPQMRSNTLFHWIKYSNNNI